MIKSILITDKEVADYMSDELYQRVLSDNVKDIEDMVKGGLHMGFYKKDRMIGVMSLTILIDAVIFHPKINRCHMIYAQRVCEIAKDHVKQAGYSAIYAKIPSNLKPNIRMAEKMGLEFKERMHDCDGKDGAKMDIDIYKVEL